MAIAPVPTDHYRRFLTQGEHLARPFGADIFGRRAEAFARFFGTPKFLIGQTLVVVAWIVINAAGIVHFDVYPFILLNLGFSLQAAYAAPLILLAQTRQADQDKSLSESDAQHREAVAATTLQRQQLAEEGIDILKKLVQENTELTKQVQDLTQEINGKMVPANG
jgi:uncharacterized membrane protein